MKSFLTKSAIIILLLCYGCSSNSKKDYEPSHKRCIDKQDDSWCVPLSWTPINQKFFHFYCRLNKADTSSFFVIGKYKTIPPKISARAYLKATYQQLMNDKSEIFTGYTVKKVTTSGKKTIYKIQYFSTINHINYVTNSTLIENEGFLFDITLKAKDLMVKRYIKDYTYVVLNFKSNNKVLFDKSSLIEKEELVDLSKIN
jgi:hypothetical protein